MDKTVEKLYRNQIDAGARCRDWLSLETTQEFLTPLKDKLKKLKEVSYEDIVQFDDRSFRSKVEAAFLAAKEIEDYFAYLDETVNGISQAEVALEGKDVESY
jgi:hypothetical protein